MIDAPVFSKGRENLGTAVRTLLSFGQSYFGGTAAHSTGMKRLNISDEQHFIGYLN